MQACRVALGSRTLIVRTRVAYCSEFCVSSTLPSVGETFTNLRKQRRGRA